MIALAAGILIAMLLLTGMRQPYARYDVIAGIILATLNGLFVTAINTLSIGKSQRTFMILNMGGNGLRAGLLLVAVMCAPLLGVGNLAVFAIVTFSGYFTFMAFEIAALNRRTNTTVQTS